MESERLSFRILAFWLNGNSRPWIRHGAGLLELVSSRFFETAHRMFCELNSSNFLPGATVRS